VRMAWRGKRADRLLTEDRQSSQHERLGITSSDRTSRASKSHPWCIAVPGRFRVERRANGDTSSVMARAFLVARQALSDVVSLKDRVLVGVELGGALRLVGPHGCGTTRPRPRHAIDGPTPRPAGALRSESTISRLRRLPERHESDALQIEITRSG
jgi:hypothetical protein